MVMSIQNMDTDKIAIAKLTKEEIIAIYSTHSVRHFPADERKPVSSIERMASEGIYTGYGLYSSKYPEENLGCGDAQIWLKNGLEAHRCT